MSETGFRMFNEAFSIGAELIYAALLTAFFKPFIPSQGRKWRKLLIVFSVYILFEIVCNRAALPQGSFGLILTALLLAVSKRLALFQRQDFQRPDGAKSIFHHRTVNPLSPGTAGGGLSPGRPPGHAVFGVPCRAAGGHALCPPVSNAETANDAPSPGAVLYQLGANSGDFVRAGDLPAAGGVRGRRSAPAL